MLKTIDINFLLIDPIRISRHNTNNKLGESKIMGSKVGTKTANFKSKSKNSVKFFSTKSQSFG